MTRWLGLLILALYLTYLVATEWARLRGKLADLLTEPANGHQPTGEALVACSFCGVHVPQARARAPHLHGPASTVDGFFCSDRCQARAAADLAGSRKA